MMARPSGLCRSIYRQGKHKLYKHQSADVRMVGTAAGNGLCGSPEGKPICKHYLACCHPAQTLGSMTT